MNKTTAKGEKAEKAIQEAFEPIFNRILCDAGIIFVDTPEETRLIREILRKFQKDYVQFWSIGQGLHDVNKKNIHIDRFYPYKFPSAQARVGSGSNFDTRVSPLNVFSIIEEDSRTKIVPEGTPKKRHIYVLRDLDKFLKDPVVIRRLKDLVYLCATSASTIVVTGYGISVPNDIEKDTTYVRLPYPTKEEIRDIILKDVRAQIKKHNATPKPREDKVDDTIDDSFNDDDVARACLGLTEDQIINALQYSMTTLYRVDIPLIIEEKKSIINKSDILEYWACKDNLKNIGGFGEIKKWFSIQKTVITNAENAAKFNTEPPKAIMLLGVQGSGKTLCAKALAQDWNVGLTKLDFSKVFAGLVGESEKRMRQALMQVDAVGGIVVIDELDKGLSGAGSSDKTDGGTTNRVIGTFLTWLNEEHPGVFLIATANDISNLRRNHPELLRKGRFDEIWFSDVPNVEEREEIFKIHLEKRGRDPEKFDIRKLSEYEFTDSSGQTYSVTGAEIESSIKDALRNKFASRGGKEIEIGSKDDINTEDIMSMLKKIKPITMIGKETISSMRKWSENNANNVSIGTTKKDKKEKVHKLNLRTDDVNI